MARETKVQKKQLSQEIIDLFKENENVIESISVNGKVINPDALKNVEVPVPTTLPASDVYDWAKQPNKPSYTASEVGADSFGSAQSVKDYIDQRLAELIGTSPDNLDTIYELAQAIVDNQDVVDALNSSITNKVDKVDGKGLSTNDVTDQMVQEWNAKSDFSGSYDDLTDKPNVVTTVDDAMSDTSENPVQNKVIKAYVDKNMNLEKEQISDTPVGHILTHMGTKAPKHYLICDGATYNVGAYPYLEQHFIEEFGSVNFFGGDGVSTFAVPDLRGEFLRGSGTNSHEGQGNGAGVGGHQDGTITPYVSYYGPASLVFFYANNETETNGPKNMDANFGARKFAKRISGSDDFDEVNSSTSYTSRPTNTSVLYCIKYEPTYAIKTAEVNYSYEERRIGTWVDGKPLYEKVIVSSEFTVTVGDNTVVEVNISVSSLDVENIVSIEGTLHEKLSGLVFPVNYINVGNSGAVVHPSFGMFYSYDRNAMVLQPSGYFNGRTFKPIVIIKYTKTTDQVIVNVQSSNSVMSSISIEESESLSNEVIGSNVIV